MLADEAPAVVVKPIQELAVLAAPGEVGRARVLHQASIGVAHVFGRLPGSAAIAAVGIGRVPVDGSKHAENGPVAQNGEALLFGYRSAALGWSANAFVAFGPGFPTDLRGIAFGEDIAATK